MLKFNLMSSLDDSTSAWKYQIPVPCRVEKMPKFCCSHQTSPKTCTFVRKTMGLRRWVGKSDLQPSSNLRMLWVFEEQHQHDVTGYNSKQEDKRRNYHGRSTVFRVFNAASRAFTLCQTRAAGSLFFQKHQREADDMLKFNVFTGWFDFRMEVSDSSSLPCRKDAKIQLQPSNLAENLHVCSEDHGIAALSGKVGPSTFKQLKNALSAWRTEPTWCNML